MKTLVLANQKGGVGKSAVATLLAHYCARLKQRVLAIDFDHQGNFATPLARSKRATEAEVTADHLLTTAGPSVPLQPFVVVPAADGLLGLERQPALHTPFARNFRSFLQSVDDGFDVCIVDTHPNPDIRLIAALASADFVLSPIQLNQEAIDGVHQLVMHHRVGVNKIKAILNPKLRLIGLLPTMVESTPFQRINLIQLVESYGHLLIPLSDTKGDFARMPKRVAVSEAQASGEVLWEVKKTAARDAWKEIEPSIAHIAGIVIARGGQHGTPDQADLAAA
jgi:chromosome partitioning protein